MTTPSAAQAYALVRDPSHFAWYVIPLMLIVLYLYSEQVAERRWSVVLGGLAFWLMDWVNEIWNGLLFHFNQVAPAWATPGGSAYVVLIGLNIEITFMFAVMGLLAVRTLPVDRNLRIAGMDNRWFMAIVNSVLCVLTEIVLNHIGVLTWDLPYWNASFPWLIFLIGYLPFFRVAYWVHDMVERRRQVQTVAVLGGGVAAALLIFGGVLGWI
ncbi:MAG TPA: hypothetical protein VF534_22885 [Paraburkholderia sp.]